MPRNNRTFPCSLALSLALLVLLASASPSFAQTTKSRATDALSWLTGCWEWRSPRGVVEEHWSATTGGMLLGFSRTMRGDSITEYEFVRIYNAGDTLVYDAHPSRQERAEFRAVGPFDAAIVFANPAHDFPQRVSYRRVGTDTLLARVEGTRNGQSRGFDFPYVRTRCP
jgi:hypothetical protein